MVSSRRFMPIIVMGAAALAACQKSEPAVAPTAPTASAAQPELSVVKARVVLAATPDRPSAAYFTIEGGPAETALTGITSTDAERIELHETRSENGLTTMAPLVRAEVPAAGAVEFRPGGKHAMLFGVSEAARAAGKIKLILAFANGETRSVDALLEAQGGDGMAGMAGMEHADH